MSCVIKIETDRLLSNIMPALRKWLIPKCIPRLPQHKYCAQFADMWDLGNVAVNREKCPILARVDFSKSYTKNSVV